MYVDHVAYGSVHLPASAQETFTRPLALGKEGLRKFGFFFGCDRFNITGMYGLSFGTFPFMREKIPNFHAAYRFFHKVQTAQCL